MTSSAIRPPPTTHLHAARRGAASECWIFQPGRCALRDQSPERRACAASAGREDDGVVPAPVSRLRGAAAAAVAATPTQRSSGHGPPAESSGYKAKAAPPSVVATKKRGAYELFRRHAGQPRRPAAEWRGPDDLAAAPSPAQSATRRQGAALQLSPRQHKRGAVPWRRPKTAP